MARSQFDDQFQNAKATMYGIGSLFLGVVAIGLFAYLALNFFRVDVPYRNIAILTKKTGIDLNNQQEVAPSAEYKGVQAEILKEGKHWLNPYHWDWEIVPQLEVEQGKSGVLVSLTGDDLGYGEFLAQVDSTKEALSGGVKTKGIVPGVLTPGRYAINPYLFELEQHDPIIVPGGYRGVVTNLAGPMPKDPNVLLVEPNFRGVQPEVLEAGTYYKNPYEVRIDLVDCRSQRFNLADKKDMGFPSKDGFWVSLDGTIEFHVDPVRAAEVFVTYNDEDNGSAIDEEIIRKVIMPVARSYCRVEGSKKSGREFITGDSRAEFEENFEKAMREKCEPVGIVIVQALIRNIRPPQQIAGPVREREMAKQDQSMFSQQILQQLSEQELASENEKVKQKPALIKAEQEVVKMTTEALQKQEVTIIKANEQLKVAELALQAAQDEAEAIRTRGKAEADVIDFNNEAEAAGWKRAVAAFSGDGNGFAKYVLNQKLAPAYQRIMANTNDSPIMKIFESFAAPSQVSPGQNRTPSAKQVTPAAVTQPQDTSSSESTSVDTDSVPTAATP